MNKHTAQEIAGNPDLYNLVWRVGRYTMECYGYSRTGHTVKFATLEPVENLKVRIILRYLDPDTVLEEVKP